MEWFYKVKRPYGRSSSSFKKLLTPLEIDDIITILSYSNETKECICLEGMSLSRKTYRQLFKKFDFCTCGTELLSSNEKVKDFSEKVKSRPQQLAVLENAHVECAICYELLFAPVALNCSHTFCQYCIGIWRKTRNTCPLCRISIENGNRVNHCGKNNGESQLFARIYKTLVRV